MAIANTGLMPSSPAFAGPSTAYQPPPPNPALVSSLFGMIDTSAANFGQANANTALSQGDTQEAGAYANAAAIANANATLAEAAGQVEQAQTGIQVRKVLGAQQAQVAAGGFGSGGTAAALLQSSTRQGTLQQQIIGMNAGLQAAGFEQQGAAAVAEQNAATAAANSAAALAASQNSIGAASKTNAINSAAALNLNIPGLPGLSGSSVPSVDATTLSNIYNPHPASVAGGPNRLGPIPSFTV